MSQENTINDSNEVAKVTKNCYSRVLDSTTLSECDNKYLIPMGRTGPLVAKIPVVLSDVEVQVDVESEIRLEESAVDIKTIDKHVFLTQCKLIPNTDKLFLAGYVQKNIQYATMECANRTSISGNVQHTTVNVQFKCATKIKFSKYPIYGKDYKDKFDVLDKNMIGKDNKEDSWFHYSKLYEPVYCELEHAKIMETDIFDQQCSINNSLSNERPFREFTEKMVIFIRLKVLQNQQVFIAEPIGDVTISDDCDPDYHYDKDKKYEEIEVGFDPEKGMIGKQVSGYEVDED